MTGNEAHPIAMTDTEIDAAIARGQLTPAPYAEKVWYDAKRDAIVARIRSTGVIGPVDVPFARRRMQGLENATPEQLAQMHLEGDGTGIVWPALDVAHYIPGLLAGVFGTAGWMAARNGRQGGRSRTPAKAMAARANGAKGGRPRTQERAASRRAVASGYRKSNKKSTTAKPRSRTKKEQSRKREPAS